jgi:alpha-L-fucosidase
VVLTSKHHDAYALWPSKFSPKWNSVEIGPGVDLLKKVSDAVRKQGLKMGYYYSLLEWKHPMYGKNNWKNMSRYVNEHMIPQMKELVSDYFPDLLYPDGEWDFHSRVFETPKFLQWLFNESPVKNTIVVNDRWGKETRGKNGGYFSTEYDTVQSLLEVKDTKRLFSKPFEECRGN